MMIDPIILFTTMVKGLIVGIVASAPMGPVGVLSVQRTLNKGRWFGFVTGVGAATSDLIYALLTGLGMSFVMDFFEGKMLTLQLGGSVILFLFGLSSFYSKPPHLHHSSKSTGTLMHNAMTGFLVTLSNPLIIFLFVALFARFTFIVPDHPVEQAIGYVALVAGALSWWYFITYIINKVRRQFNVTGIWMLNRIIGVIVMVVSLCGLCITLTGKHFY